MKIICIENGYASVGRPAEPIFYLKPDTALLRNNDPFYIPDFTRRIEYGCELVVRINRVGKCIESRFAHRYYDEVGLGIGFTAADLLQRAESEGLPWESAKSFDRSAALSPRFLPLAETGDINALNFAMEVNGQIRQQGATKDMQTTIDEIISRVSRFMTLKMGDLIYTGTPCAEVTACEGDNVRGTLGGEELMNFDIR